MKFDNGKDKESLRKCFAMYLKCREKINLFMEELNFVWQVDNSKDEEDSESEDEDENDESDTEEMEGKGDCDGSVNEEKVEEMDESENVGDLKTNISDLRSYRYYDWIWQVIPKKMFNKFFKKISEKEEPEYYNGDLKDCLKQVQRVKKKWKHCRTNQFYDCSSETINAICKCFYDIDQGRLDYSKNDMKKIGRILGINAIHIRSLINPACSMDRKRNLIMRGQVGKQVVSVLSQIVIPEIKSTLAEEN